MNCSPCQCKEDIRRHAIEYGACACGFARADELPPSASDFYDDWVDTGSHGDMEYCRRHTDIRRDPRLLLDGASTVISCAFNYYNPDRDGFMPRSVAKYAWGKDYHWIVKQRLLRLGEYIERTYGGNTRPLVDSAPIRERYWAQQAGIGFVGANCQLIVPGVGSYVFLSELLWTGTVPSDAPCADTCLQCRACVKACPGQALDGSGACDARRCISYLTIEHKGDVPEDIDTRGMIYGCDICQRVCPHNAGAPVTEIPEFAPDEELLSLTKDDITNMTSSHFKRITRLSAMSRITLRKLRSNLTE